MSVADTALCSVPGCGGPASGVCLNNLDFEECPNVLPPESSDTVLVPLEPSEVIRTSVGSTLNTTDADVFLRSRGGIVVAAVAGPSVGKTTLVATMYELAHRGRLEGITFAGSDTITGFEERCFLSRSASEEDSADTPRTPFSFDLAFLHLGLVLADGRRIEILFSDRSGEHFEEAFDRPDLFNQFVELARADAILLLLDAERLADNHHVEIARMRKLLTGLAHAGLLNNRRIHLVLTKNDRIDGEGRRSHVDRRAADLVDEIKRRTSDAEVQLHLTACRARLGSSSIGDGVGTLITALVPNAPSRIFQTRIFSPTQASGTTLDRLLLQTRPD